jgi:hypothetical protein
MNPFPPRCRAQFEQKRLIASGGFGSVHLARQLALDRPVAIKLLDPARLADSDEVARFLNEAKVTATLNHPGIVVLIDHDVEDGQPWIAYEYVPGRTLRAILDAGPLPVPRALAAVRQVAEALQAAHERGVIHRDIKPQNILEVEEGRYKVADFGIAKWSSGSVQTQAGLILGTPAYLAPEQVVGEVATARSDLYALGIVLHELLAGRPPFGSEVSALRDHLTTPPPPIPRADVPREVQGLVHRLLAKAPADRPETAGELARDISRIMDQCAEISPPPPAARPPHAPLRAAAVLFALGLLVAGALALRRSGHDAATGPASPSPTVPAALAAIVARHLPEYDRTKATEPRRAEQIAKACLHELADEDGARGPAMLPDEMCEALINMVGRRHRELELAISKWPFLDNAQTLDYTEMTRLCMDIGDAVFATSRSLRLEQLFARVTSGLLSRRLLNLTTGDLERPLALRIRRWRERYPETIAARMLEMTYDLESGHKERVAERAIALLDGFARQHLPPRGPPPDVAMLDEWCRLVYECHGSAIRAGAKTEVVDIVDIHARAFPRFGALMGHRTAMRRELERRLNGLPK